MEGERSRPWLEEVAQINGLMDLGCTVFGMAFTWIWEHLIGVWHKRQPASTGMYMDTVL